MGKRESSKVNETQGFLTLGHSICKHLKLAMLVLSQHFSSFLPLILGGPIPYHPKLQREKGRKEQGLKMGKGKSPKVNETQGFLTLGHSNWTICSL